MDVRIRPAEARDRTLLMNLFNLRLFTLCTIGCFLAFALFYWAVYWLTSRVYYGIVKK